MASRSYQRSSTPTIGFFPVGLLGLLLLLFVLIYGLTWFAQGIESTVRAEVTETLADNDLAWVNVDVSGQNVVLSGEGPTEDGDRAVALARAVTGPTWTGLRRAPVRVRGLFGADMPTDGPGWGNLTATLEDGTLRLAGTVGSEAEKAALLRAAQAPNFSLNVTEVEDNITVTPAALAEGSDVLASRVVESIVGCIGGEARSANGVFSMDCQAPRATADDVRTAATAPLAAGTLGSVTVRLSEDCNTAFAEVLQGRTIQFAYSSAALRRSATPLLDEIADVARSCPGRIRVEGHSDDTGSLEPNMRLSLARAQAVVNALVDRGLSTDNLVAEGFGPTRPRVQGTSRQARAQNRRIEFYLIDEGAN